MSQVAAAEFNNAVVEVFEVRRMVPGDLPFVRDSWVRQAWQRERAKLKAQGMGRRKLDRATQPFYAAVRPKVTELIEREDVAVLVACERQDPAHIGGWVAVDLRQDEEIASYVKADYRPWGIAGLLKQAMEAL